MLVSLSDYTEIKSTLFDLHHLLVARCERLGHTPQTEFHLDDWILRVTGANKEVIMLVHKPAFVCVRIDILQSGACARIVPWEIRRTHLAQAKIDRILFSAEGKSAIISWKNDSTTSMSMQTIGCERFYYYYSPVTFPSEFLPFIDSDVAFVVNKDECNLVRLCGPNMNVSPFIVASFPSITQVQIAHRECALLLVVSKGIACIKQDARKRIQLYQYVWPEPITIKLRGVQRNYLSLSLQTKKKIQLCDILFPPNAVWNDRNHLKAGTEFKECVFNLMCVNRRLELYKSPCPHLAIELWLYIFAYLHFDFIFERWNLYKAK
jgi:hypothetical protein